MVHCTQPIMHMVAAGGASPLLITAYCIAQQMPLMCTRIAQQMPPVGPSDAGHTSDRPTSLALTCHKSLAKCGFKAAACGRERQRTLWLLLQEMLAHTEEAAQSQATLHAARSWPARRVHWRMCSMHAGSTYRRTHGLAIMQEEGGPHTTSSSASWRGVALLIELQLRRSRGVNDCLGALQGTGAHVIVGR